MFYNRFLEKTVQGREKVNWSAVRQGADRPNLSDIQERVLLLGPEEAGLEVIKWQLEQMSNVKTAVTEDVLRDLGLSYICLQIGRNDSLSIEKTKDLATSILTPFKNRKSVAAAEIAEYGLTWLEAYDNISKPISADAEKTIRESFEKAETLGRDIISMVYWRNALQHYPEAMPLVKIILSQVLTGKKTISAKALGTAALKVIKEQATNYDGYSANPTEFINKIFANADPLSADNHKVLGVDKNAPIADIENAYRILYVKYYNGNFNNPTIKKIYEAHKFIMDREEKLARPSRVARHALKTGIARIDSFINVITKSEEYQSLISNDASWEGLLEQNKRLVRDCDMQASPQGQVAAARILVDFSQNIMKRFNSARKDTMSEQTRERVQAALETFSTFSEELVLFPRLVGDTEPLSIEDIRNACNLLSREYFKGRDLYYGNLKAGMKLEVIIDTDKAPPAINPLEFFGILDNFFSNSSRAMEDMDVSRINIRISIAGKSWQLEFSDTGKGIPSDKYSWIFEEGNSTSQETGGGMGLAFAKEIVEEAGGTIDVQSELGKGTTFIIKLPLQPTVSLDNALAGQDKVRTQI